MGKSENLPAPTKLSDFNIKVRQSYIMTVAQYNFSLDEKRIVYRIVEYAQDTIDQSIKKVNEPYKNCMRNLCCQELIGGDKILSFYISDILNVSEADTSKHYKRIQLALESLMEKTVKYETKELDEKTNEEEIVWNCKHLIESSKIRPISGLITFRISSDFWAMILDFSRGYREYELFTIMKLDSVYSMRFYELMSKQKMAKTFLLEKFADMFCLTDKYINKPSNIINRIIKPAKEELDKKAPYSFNYSVKRSGKGGKTSPIVAFTFYPIKHEENQDLELQRIERQSKLTASNLFKDSLTYNTLRYDYDFKSVEINKNKKTISEGEETISNWIDFLTSLKDSKGYKEAISPKGYVIQAIKRKTKEQKELKQPKEETKCEQPKDCETDTTKKVFQPGDTLPINPPGKKYRQW